MIACAGTISISIQPKCTGSIIISALHYLPGLIEDEEAVYYYTAMYAFTDIAIATLGH